MQWHAMQTKNHRAMHGLRQRYAYSIASWQMPPTSNACEAANFVERVTNFTRIHFGRSARVHITHTHTQAMCLHLEPISSDVFVLHP